MNITSEQLRGAKWATLAHAPRGITRPAGNLSFILPIEVISEANRRGHWSKHSARAREQRKTVALICGRDLRDRAKPSVITLTSIRKRFLDSDNLCSGFKACRDQLANELGFNDRDESVEWKYAQRKPMKDEQLGTEVVIEWTK